MGIFRHSISRRGLLKGAAAVGLSAPAIWTFDRAFAADQITMADYGGKVSEACRKAYHDPFEKETGIHVVSVATDADPVTQWKLLVDGGNYLWDGSMVTPDYIGRLTQGKNYLEPLNVTKEEAATLIPGAVTENFMAFQVFAMMMAYRTDKFPNGGPVNWADFFDLKKFPGTRGLYRGVQGMMEMVLLGDGVPPDQLYPLDVERALRKLDTIKEHVVWWTSGAQLTQLLESGDVDLSDAWNTRADAAIESGAPVKMVWDGLWGSDGWALLAGTPRADLARKFVKFCMGAQPQADYTKILKTGPTNQAALKLLDPALLPHLPTYPENMKHLRVQDFDYWSKNNAKVIERFEEWILT